MARVTHVDLIRTGRVKLKLLFSSKYKVVFAIKEGLEELKTSLKEKYNHFSSGKNTAYFYENNAKESDDYFVLIEYAVLYLWKDSGSRLGEACPYLLSMFNANSTEVYQNHT